MSNDYSLFVTMWNVEMLYFVRAHIPSMGHAHTHVLTDTPQHLLRPGQVHVHVDSSKKCVLTPPLCIGSCLRSRQILLFQEQIFAGAVRFAGTL